MVQGLWKGFAYQMNGLTGFQFCFIFRTNGCIIICSTLMRMPYFISVKTVEWQTLMGVSSTHT